MINKNFYQYKQKCIKIKELIKLLYRNTDITISQTKFPYTKNNFQLTNFYLLLDKQNQNLQIKISIKKWLVSHRLKLIQILNLLYDCYSRIINLKLTSIENTKIHKIIEETKNILINELIRTHRLGSDDGTELCSTLPYAPITPLPQIKVVRKVSKPIPIPVRNKQVKKN